MKYSSNTEDDAKRKQQFDLFSVVSLFGWLNKQ